RSRLPLIIQTGFILSDAMGQLMADHVNRLCKALEDDPIAVAVYHLAAIPEGIIVLLAVMHAGIEPHAAVVDGVAAVLLLVKIVGGAGSLVGFVHHRIARR